jgi:hypothetical protein
MTTATLTHKAKVAGSDGFHRILAMLIGRRIQAMMSQNLGCRR